MGSKFKTWQERLNQSKTPLVKQLEFDFAGLKGGTMMLVSAPQEIDEYIRRIPFGKTCSIKQMGAELAQKHGADAICPASTSIFLRIVAEAACEELQAGKDVGSITPFWRVVEPGSRLVQKLACGINFLEAMWECEGVQTAQTADYDAANA